MNFSFLVYQVDGLNVNSVRIVFCNCSCQNVAKTSGAARTVLHVILISSIMD